MNSVAKELLQEVAGFHSIPQGAFNIRENGKLVERKNIDGIDSIIAYVYYNSYSDTKFCYCNKNTYSWYLLGDDFTVHGNNFRIVFDETIYGAGAWMGEYFGNAWDHRKIVCAYVFKRKISLCENSRNDMV